MRGPIDSAAPPTKGSARAIATAYLASDAFGALKTTVQEKRRREIARFVEKNRSSVATDLDGAQVYLASSAFNLQWTAERNPDIKFVDIKTTTV